MRRRAHRWLAKSLLKAGMAVDRSFVQAAALAAQIDAALPEEFRVR